MRVAGLALLLAACATDPEPTNVDVVEIADLTERAKRAHAPNPVAARETWRSKWFQTSGTVESVTTSMVVLNDERGTRLRCAVPWSYREQVKIVTVGRSATLVGRFGELAGSTVWLDRCEVRAAD